MGRAMATADEMNNEPVAIVELGGEVTWLTDVLPYKAKLYTHPVKEQDTDCQYCKQGCIRCDARKQLTDEEIIAVGNAVVNHIDSNEGWIEFARAILRKAGEK
jgi:hypothetical protein